MLLLITILVPIAGVVASAVRLRRSVRRALYAAIMLLTGVLGLCTALFGGSLTIFQLTETVPLALSMDGMGRLFLALVLLLYTVSTFYAFEYLEHDRRWNMFFGFWFASLSAMISVCMAANLVTLYLSFELATLTTMPLVLHDRTKEATAAALKYLFYSIGGALLGLFAVLTLSSVGAGDFVYGGTMPAGSGREELLRTSVVLGIVGFGAKAGMYPLHGWLPAAHPVAPAPASALLSGIIVKAGILAVIRLVYYTAGPELLRGSWAQIVWMVLACVTVFTGSMMAWREKVLKKRLAYSTVSQLSYIMLGLSLLCEGGLKGALLHTCAHVCAKGALFLCAGVFIHKLGKRNVEEMRGLVRQMPITVWCFWLAGLSLVGIPPMGGFVSKWQIALTAIQKAPAPFSILIPVILLLSALLTAGYLLAPAVDAFFPSRDEKLPDEKAEPTPMMTVPLIILCCGTLAVGLFGNLLF